MFDLNGFDPDEEEKKRQLLGGLLGGITPQEPAGPTEEPQPMATPGLQAPDTSFMQSGQQGLGGYTPPPAAQSPEFLQKVQSGHEFGAGDIAMLGGIIAALVAGGKNGGAIAGGLAGQYGQGVIGDMQQRNQRNAEIDVYNNKLANQDTELARWEKDQEAQLSYGNLEARKTGQDLEKQHIELQKARMEAEANPDSPAAQAKLAQLQKKLEIEGEAEVGVYQKKSDIELNQRKLLAELVGARGGRAASGHAAPTGKGAAPTDPVKALRAKEAAAKLAGIDAGTYDPVTGKPISGDTGEKPLTPPQKLAREKYDALKTPIPGLEIEDEEAWAASVTTPGARDKVAKYWQGVQQTKNALSRMKTLREANGAEMFGEKKAAYDAALTAAIGGFTQIGNSGVLNGGEFARYKDMIPGMAPRLADVGRLVGGEDQTVAELTGVMSEVDSLAADGLAVAGVRPGSGKSKGGPAASKGSKATPSAGFSEGEPSTGVTSGGKRLVTMKHSKTGKTDSQELDEASIQALTRKGWVLQ